MKKIIRQRGYDDNVSAIIKNLVTQLDIKVSFTEIDESVQNHPSFPEIEDLNEILNEWGIKLNTINTDINELVHHNCPFITKIFNNSRPFYILVVKVESHSITYIHTEKGFVKENLYLFAQKRSSSLEAIELSQRTGENDYEQAIKTERSKKLKKRFLKVSISLIMALFLFVGIKSNEFSYKWLIFFGLQLLGAYFSNVILLAHYDESKLFNNFLFLGDYTNWLIPRNYKIDHKILGKFYSKEILAIYFSGGLLFLLTGILSKDIIAFLSILYIVNMLFLPIAILNLFKYCYSKYWIIYLILNVIVILEFLCLFQQTFSSLTLQFDKWILLFLSFSLPVAIWFLIKPKLDSYNGINQKLTNLKAFKHPIVLKQILDSSPTLEMNPSKYGIYSGKVNARIQITIFISPTDIRSGYLFLFFMEVVREQPNIKLITKLLITNNYFSDYVTRLIFNFSSSNSPEDTSSLIESWFLDSTKDIDLFKKSHKLQEINQNLVDQLINESENIFQQDNSIYPSMILINNRIVPDYYEVEDIEYLLKYSM